MDTPSNRMLKPGRKPEGTQITVPAPPVAVPGRVAPFTCPHCGRRDHHQVRETFADKGYAAVICKACRANLQYMYATELNPVPRVRYVNP